mmetsp:Transcript_2631/g.3084  ORF Transcript_2631/g.3084 Transcript_2631/m.3084 type:complete len:92 (-) Transcript_2631:88-363(-)
MDSALNYLNGLLSGAQTKIDTNFQVENNQILMKEASKVDSVLKTMNFCADECEMNFSKGDNEDSMKLSCFNSCAAKTFEMKQIESYNRSLF